MTKKKKVLELADDKTEVTITKMPDVAAEMADAVKKSKIKNTPKLLTKEQIYKEERGKWLSKNNFVNFWDSLIKGQYINPKNRKAVVAHQRRKDIIRTKGMKRLVTKHGKIIVEKIVAKKSKSRLCGSKTVDLDYFGEKNQLEAVGNMLCRGTRKTRRNLCKKLGFRWDFYKEAEETIMDLPEFSGFGYDAIKANHGVK